MRDLQARNEGRRSGLIQSARRAALQVIFVGIAYLFWGGCAEDSSNPEPESYQVQYVVEGGIYSAGDTVWVGAEIDVPMGIRAEVDFDYSLRLQLLTPSGRILLDTTAALHDADTLQMTRRFEASDSLIFAQSEILDPSNLVHPAPLQIRPTSFQVLTQPREGTAPLSTTTTIRALTGLVDSLSVDFENRGTADTVLLMQSTGDLTWQTFVLSHTFGVLDDTLKITAYHSGNPPRESFRSVRIQSRNTPPYVTQGLPFIYYNEDPADGIVRDIDGNDVSILNLNHHFQDAQSSLTFTVQGESAFHYALQDSMLHLSILHNGNGSGELPIIATDANNASATRALEFYVDAMTDIQLGITNVENSQALSGQVNVNEEQYLTTPEQPTVFIQIYPTETQIRGMQLLNSQPHSYVRTISALGLEDDLNVTPIPVVTVFRQRIWHKWLSIIKV